MPRPRCAVRVVEDRQPDRHRVPVLDQVADEHQVAERLRHLGAVQLHHRRVEPVAYEALAGGPLGLGGLALVVGEDQVGAAAVEVDADAQLPQGQGRALDVPARPSRAPLGAPGRLVGRRGLPQDEVEGIALGRVVGVATPFGRQRQHLVPAQVAELAEPFERGHVEVDAASCQVGVTPVEHHADEAQDVVDGRRGARFAVGGEHAEGSHVGLEPGRLLGGQLQVGNSQLTGLAEEVVVDIGDVADTQRAMADVAKAALQDVVQHVGGGVAHVGGVVGRDPARVHGDDRAGPEFGDLAAGGVVQAHRRQSPTPVSRIPARRLIPIRTAVNPSTMPARASEPDRMGRRPGMASTRSAVASAAMGWSAQMMTSPTSGRSSRPRSRAGMWLKAVATRAAGAACCTAAATDPSGRRTGRSSPSILARALPIEITTLPPSSPATDAAVSAEASQIVATTTRSALAASGLVAGWRASSRSGQRDRSSSQAVSARSTDRDPMTTSQPTDASRTASACPAGPVPPRMPTYTVSTLRWPDGGGPAWPAVRSPGARLPDTARVPEPPHFQKNRGNPDHREPRP